MLVCATVYIGFNGPFHGRFATKTGIDLTFFNSSIIPLFDFLPREYKGT